MKYLKNWKDFEGLTIERIIPDEGYFISDIWVTFTNGDRAVIEARGDYDGGGSLTLGDPVRNIHDLYRAGWMPESDYRAALGEESKAYAERQKEKDLKKLAELKAKYEGETPWKS